MTSLPKLTSFTLDYENWKMILPDIEDNQLLQIDLRTKNIR